MRRSIHERRELLPGGDDGGGYTLSSFVSEFVRKVGIMDAEFFQSYTFMGIMAVLLIALIGVLLFLRSKRPEE